MTKSLRATFEKLHPRSGRFYDAETNRYFALSKQAGDTGKRVDSDSQQFWEFLQLACGALQGELDEARGQVAALRKDLDACRDVLADIHGYCDPGNCDELFERVEQTLDDTASTAKAHDKSIWDEAVASLQPAILGVSSTRLWSASR